MLFCGKFIVNDYKIFKIFLSSFLQHILCVEILRLYISIFWAVKCNKIFFYLFLFSSFNFFFLFCFWLNEHNELCLVVRASTQRILSFSFFFVFHWTVSHKLILGIKAFRPHSYIHRLRLEFVQCIVYLWGIQCISWSLKCLVQSWLLIAIKSAKKKWNGISVSIASQHHSNYYLYTSWMRALCFRIFLDFIIRTIAAWRYSFRSSSTELIVCSTSCGVSFWRAAVILNFVRLFE